MYDTTEEDGRPAEEPADTTLVGTPPSLRTTPLLRTPPLLLAGVDEDEWELHLVRGID